MPSTAYRHNGGLSVRTLTDEAATCRMWAVEFKDGPEHEILLHLGSEFERLALAAGEPLPIVPADLAYFARRAAQAATAAHRAAHPKARLAHLKMAHRYRSLAYGSARHLGYQLAGW